MRQGIGQAPRRVSDLFRPNTRLWDRAKIRDWLGDDMVELAEELRLLREPKDDKLIWLGSLKGSFDLKSAYWTIAEATCNPKIEMWKRL